MMACRVNAKKEKRTRNVENMRKFKKPSGKKVCFPPFPACTPPPAQSPSPPPLPPQRFNKGPSKSPSVVAMQARNREAEAAFVASLYTTADPEAEAAKK